MGAQWTVRVTADVLHEGHGALARSSLSDHSIEHVHVPQTLNPKILSCVGMGFGLQCMAQLQQWEEGVMKCHELWSARLYVDVEALQKAACCAPILLPAMILPCFLRDKSDVVFKSRACDIMDEDRSASLTA